MKRIVAAVIHQETGEVEIIVEETKNKSWHDETIELKAHWIQVDMLGVEKN